MKNLKYNEPEFKVVITGREDIITGSTGDFGSSNGFNDNPAPGTGGWGMPDLEI